MPLNVESIQVNQHAWHCRIFVDQKLLMSRDAINRYMLGNIEALLTTNGDGDKLFNWCSLQEG
jgi:hypothetical protein